MAEKVSAGLRNIKTVRDFNLKDRTVFLRLDLNVPMEDGKITDELALRPACRRFSIFSSRVEKL